VTASVTASCADGLLVQGRIERGGFVLELDLAVGPGEVLAVLGPNGAGKTSLLRAVAGLTALRRGTVRIDRLVLDDGAGTFVPPEQRPVSLVFQDYRLFPHLSVRDNVAFAPRSTGNGRSAARAIADDWIDRLGLGPLASHRPRQLSGGQAQRVALARALAADPRVLLLDEPLAALDARTGAEVRGELRRHLGAFGGATVLVTHDPLEALVLADRLLVLEQGRVVQQGRPQEVARRPATQYVARLMGLNLYSGTADADGRVLLAGGGELTTPAGAAGGPVLVAVRPSAITLHAGRPAGSSRNVWPGEVTGLELLVDRVRVDVAGAPSALVDITPAAFGELGLAAGTPVWLAAKATDVEVYPAP
jgi:molybdate transport system ATP-binding protein